MTRAPRLAPLARTIGITLITGWLTAGAAIAAPTLAITNPANGATVSGTVSVTVSAGGFGNLTKVEFYRDGAVQTTDIASPWSWSWATTGVADGSHTLHARGYDKTTRQWTTSGTITVTVANNVDQTPPVISSIQSTGLAATTATITWTTNEPANSQVDYGLTTSYGQSSPLDAARVTSHSVNLAGLTPTTTYHYRVRSADAAGNSAVSTDRTFMTTTPPDPNPPTGTITINDGAPYATTPTVTLTLSATDAEGPVTQMRFSNDGSAYSTPEPYATTKSWTLSAGDGEKTVSAQFQDAASNWSAAASDAIVLDTTPPTVQITNPQDQQVLTGP